MLVAGNEGRLVLGWPRPRVDVRSPTVCLRQAEMFGAFTPKRASRNRSIDVWSKVWESTHPPRLQGEITIVGTRNPSPMGWRNPPSSPTVGVAVTVSSAVPGGGVGGGTWSKKPPFSSYIRNSAVFDHTAGLDVRASSTSEVKYMPRAGEPDGCSSHPA